MRFLRSTALPCDNSFVGLHGRKHRPSVLLSLLLWPSFLTGQSPLDWNSLKSVQLEIKLDRTVYLPGEDFRLRFLITNRSSTPVSIPAPLDQNHSSLDGYEGDSPDLRQLRPLSPGPFRIHPPSLPTHGVTITIGPGATWSHEKTSDELAAGGYLLAAGFGPTLPCQSGSYVLAFTLGLGSTSVAARTSFRILPAELLDDQRLELTPVDMPVIGEEGSRKAIPSVDTLILRADGRTFLVYKTEPFLTEIFRKKDGLTAEIACRLLAPFERLDESAAGFRDISLEAVSPDRTQIRWRRIEDPAKLHQFEARTGERIERARGSRKLLAQPK